MEACEYCGCETYYTKDYIKGRGTYYYRFDGEPIDNSGYYDGVVNIQGKRAYCVDCDKYLFAIDNQ